ncbi:MAG: putative porin, partial [Acidobacteria bacterium]|nr:putative porin [Acidobacteriota bacterium]
MRKLLLTVSLLLALPLVALAQDAPKVEVFGGYPYLNPDDGD